jgi:peptidyl-prolyl cis-trans isomerase SurA
MKNLMRMHNRFCSITLGMIIGFTGLVHAGETLDSIAAVVNTDVVLHSELDQAVSHVQAKLRANGKSAPEEEVLRGQVLEQLVTRRIQLQQAQKTGIRVGDDSLNNAINQIAKQNNMELEGFREALAQQNVDFAQFREEKREEMMIGRLQQREVVEPITVSDQEIELFLANPALQNASGKELRLAHILVSLPESPSPQELETAQQKINAVVAALRGGADFAETAIRESEGQTALQGGDLGWRKMAQLPTLFADVAVNMVVGNVSDPIRSSSGFHIIKLMEERSSQESMVTETLARHILLQPNEVLTDDAARIKLEEIHQQLVAGKDFAEMAQTNSTDPGSASRGGSLGWVTPGVMVAEFEEQMDQLEPGEISKPFRTQFGWHVVKVDDRRKQDHGAAKQRDHVRKLLMDRKVGEAIELWVRKLRDEAYVEIRG